MIMSEKKHRACIMLGGNIGDVPATFERAAAFLAACGVVIEHRSAIGKSKAVDCVPGTPDFCDQALLIGWDGSPEALLQTLQQTEIAFGRPEKHRRDESRTLDCDLILFDAEQRRTATLTLPHPRARQRRFVLELLVEIAPDWRFPDTGETVREAYCRLPAPAAF